MKSYDKDALLHYLNGDVVAALGKLFNVSYRQIAGPLRCSAANIKYHIHNDSFAPWQKRLLLQMFMNRGLEAAELVFLHQLIQVRK
ncbi:hypothetical protein [Bacillus cereus]|uniref:hypothetical protein n=1 Tax=Bacillus cereus TaxID=1396 RepID=UPI0025701B5A|nr:hypothetical protein [Bacillus cereus]WJE28129.1 hypothetical protein QRE65_15535 [Bacillus cereus]